MSNTRKTGRTAGAAARIVAGLFLLTLLAPPDASGQGTASFSFENPPPDSFQSGVTVISGWACEANRVEVILRGALATETVEMNYGTPRADAHTSLGGPCASFNTGFGATTNLNRLGTGAASAELRIDGQVAATHAFTVTKPTSRNRDPDLTGTYTLPGFPEPGQAVDVVWQTSTQNFGIAPAGLSTGTEQVAAADQPACPPGFPTKCTLESPGGSQFMSGIVVLYGWACNVGNEIRIELKGASARETIIPGYGSARDDTNGILTPGAPCDDSDNGFGALTNVNRLGTGPATAELWIDGNLGAINHFWVTRPSDGNRITGLDAEYRVPEFPTRLQDTVLVWQTALQNFAIKNVAITSGPTPTPGPIPTPGITPTPAGTSTPTPTGTAGPGPSPTPTPGSGPVCGNGIAEAFEECDGNDFAGETCDSIIGGWDPAVFDANCAEGSVLECAADCTLITTGCSCPCEVDDDCGLPDHYTLDCSPLYCPEVCTDPIDLEDCLDPDFPGCAIGGNGDLFGACLGSNANTGAIGRCMTNPFDPGEGDSELFSLCFGYDEGDLSSPRCWFCDEF